MFKGIVLIKDDTREVLRLLVRVGLHSQLFAFILGLVFGVVLWR
jgi:hypothetical protein